MSYSIGEIISEKMRSLMQRTMPIDLYDIWYLFETENYNIEDYIPDFQKKAEFKKLIPGQLIETVLNTKDKFKRQWEKHLINQIKDVPDFDEVWEIVRKAFEKV